MPPTWSTRPSPRNVRKWRAPCKGGVLFGGFDARSASKSGHGWEPIGGSKRKPIHTQATEPECAAALGAWLGKSVARKAWYHDIECVRGISAMGRRVGQQLNQFVEA